MLKSNNTEISLSYDESGDRSEEVKKIRDAGADGVAALTALSAGFAAIAATAYNWDVNSERRGQKWDQKAEKYAIDMESDNISTLGASDQFLFAQAIGTAAFAKMMAKGADLKPVEHKSPTAKISLTKESIVMFAGASSAPEAILKLTKKEGLFAECDKAMVITSKSESITVTAAKEVTVKANTAMKIDATIQHRNMVVSK